MELKASPEFEKRIGIWFYSTNSEGIGGTIKTIPADFNVREITNREEQEDGKYLIAELTKDNWDTHGVIREIAHRLRVSRNRIGFAGTKDKFAVTKQKISIWSTEENELARVNIADVSLDVIGRSNKAVSLGDLYGNEFEIVIRGVEGRYEVVKDKIDAITNEIGNNGGIANFFGVQRFGITRPITHVVGRHLINGDINGAVMSYISDIFPGESEAAKQARMLCKSGKLKESLKIMPLRYERAMLNALIKKDGDSLSAFHSLPKNLQKLFVHAYQSYLFNIILSQRMKQNLPFNVAIAGDVVCFHNEFGFPDPDKVEKVTANKIEGMNRLLKRGRAFVTVPIFGYETEFADGVVGAIERKVLEEEAIERDNFYIEKMPELSSKGTSRPVLLPVESKAEISDDELNPGQLKAKLNFFLPKGTYATVLLREYMKDE
uniref:Probable tRNA pseudouridine synthase D n=1 Tax=Candidatus Methanophaga sp. ANME-1 ERB7 TaxID=2759913 RepID=A0A7G9Z8F6_9EURY|nr:putative tRNA pseudouridine synthase D [Methanosarcinales archaeon ANME-1 ERB7]